MIQATLGAELRIDFLPSTYHLVISTNHLVISTNHVRRNLIAQ
jgi:hypothetical protein